MATIAGSLRNKVLVLDDVTTGDLTVTGSVTFTGTATTINSTNTTINDHLIEINAGLTGTNPNDLGLILERGSSGNNVFIGWDESADKVVLGLTTGDGSSTGNLSLTYANFQAATATFTGTISSGAITSTSEIIAASGGNEIKLGTDGNIEITRTTGFGYIDFKNSASEDFDQRIQANSTGHSFSGTISSGAITTSAALQVQHSGTNNISLSPTSTGGVINARNSSGTSVVVMDGRGAPFIDVTGNLKTGGTTRIDSSGNLSNIGTISSSGQITTGYGLSLENGNTNFLLYNNANDNLLYMRDTTNGQMLTTWYPTIFTVNKELSVTGDIKKGGTVIMDSSRNLTNIASIKVSATGTTPSSSKLHVGAINSSSSSAIAQFGGFIRASNYLILHDGAGSANTVQMRNTGGHVDLTQGEGTSATPPTRVNSIASPDGTQIVFPNNNGNVMIGSTGTPSAKLEVAGTLQATSTGAATLILRGDSNNSGDTGQLDSTIKMLHDDGTHGVLMETKNYAGKQSFEIKSLSAGTESSRFLIHEDNYIVTSGDIYIPSKIIHVGDTDTYFAFEDNTHRFFAAGEEMLKFNSSLLTINEAGGNNDFRVKGNTDNDLLYVDGSADKVGIGTNSPNFPLHINKGTSSYTPTSGVNENVFGVNTSSYADGRQGVSFSRLDGNWIDGTSGTDTAYGWVWSYLNDVRGGLVYDHRGSERMQLFSSYGALGFITPDAADGNGVPTDSNMAERLTILPGGNVGIGATSPAFKLDVSGNIRSSGYIRVNSGGSFRLYNSAGSGWVELLFDESNNMLQVQRGIKPSSDSSLDLGTNTVRWNRAYVDTYYGDGSNLTGVAPVKKGTVTLTNSYQTVCTVNGSGLASTVRMTINGTGPSTVIATILDIIVNHSLDIFVTSQTSSYTQLTVQIISNNNEDFAIQIKTNSANNLPVAMEVFALNSEAITFTSTNPYSGASLEHVCKNAGFASSSTGGNTHEFYSNGTKLIAANDNQALHDTDALSISGNVITLKKGNNATETVTVPSLSGYATESYVGTQINNLIDGAPGTLNTLNELAAAVSDNNTFFSTVVPKSGGTMTGLLEIAKSTSIGDPTLDLHNTTNGYGVNIRMTDVSDQSGQFGYITYYHQDSKSYGSGASITLRSTEGTTTILADGKLMYAEGIYKKPATGTGAGTRKDANWDTAYGWGDHGSEGYLTSSSTQSKYLRSDTADTATGVITFNSTPILAGTTSLEGGELNFGAPTGGVHSAFALDNYEGNFRIHTLQSGKNFQIVGAGESQRTTINTNIGTVWGSNNDGPSSGLNADLLDGLELHTGRNNVANRVVRTDGNGYIQAGWINTTSGSTTGMDRIYASNDGYIRYVTKATFGAGIGPHISYNDITNKPTIPTNNNQLTNGASYITGLAFNNLTNKTSATGEYSTSGFLRAGRGSGGVGLTHNDGYGNANVTFNHVSGIPEQAGNCGRIVVNTDSTTSATMYFELKTNSGTSAVNTPSAMELTETGAYFPQYLYHMTDSDTHIRYTDDRVRIVAGGTVKFDSNNTYLTSHQSLSGLLPLAGGTMTGTLNMGGNAFTGNNFNISGVNQISLNDPGEGIVFGSQCNLYLLDDAADNILRLDAPGGFRLHNGPLSMGTTTVIDGSRNITAGTISSGVLSVNSGTANIAATFQSTDSIAGIKLQDSGGNVELSASGSTFRVQPSGGTPVFEVNSSGNGTFTGGITIDGGVYSTPVSYAANQDNWALKIGASNNAGWDFAGIKLRVNGTGNPRMSLMGVGENEAISIVGSNVGIGSIAPAQKLDVQGTILVNNEIQFVNSAMRIYRSGDNMKLRAGSLDRITILSDGKVGIKTDSPTYTLDVNGDMGMNEYLYHNDDDNTHLRFLADRVILAAGGRWVLDCDEGTDPDILKLMGDAQRAYSDGTFHVKGDIIAYSTTTTSDRRLKKNIQPLENSLEKVQKLQGVSFDWKDEDKGSSIGFIAQDFEKELPDLIKEVRSFEDKDDSIKTINYGNTVALLVEAIKEQQSIINRLEDRINILEDKQEK